MARRLGLLYDRWLHQAPLLTKALTSATLFGVGDRLAQRAEAQAAEAQAAEALVVTGDSLAEAEQGGERDELLCAGTRRTLRMMVWGGCFLAPTLHKWFAFVDRIIPGTGAVVLAKKVALDMFFFAPQISLAFFVTTKCMEGEYPNVAVDEGLERLPATLQANYSIWPLANVVSFSIVPIQYRLLFSNCVSLYWSSFLSRMASTRVEGGATGTDRDIRHAGALKRSRTPVFPK